jgi:hypothetical protein
MTTAAMPIAWQTTEPPRDGRTIIVWTSSTKGFADMTCAVHWYEAEQCWMWDSSEAPFKGVIHGWLDWPEPHGTTRPDGTAAIIAPPPLAAPEQTGENNG